MSDFEFDVQLVIPSQINDSVFRAVFDELQLAAEFWARHIDVDGSLSIGLFFDSLSDLQRVDGSFVSANVVAFAGPTQFFLSGEQVDGFDILSSATRLELTGTTDFSGLTSLGDFPPSDDAIFLPVDVRPFDIFIGVNTRFLDSTFIGDSSDTATVPAGLLDIQTVLVHEIGHGLGFFGFPDRGPTGNMVTPFQSMVERIDGSLFFTGENAVAAFGGPVPVDEDLTHLGSPRFIMDPFIFDGERQFISSVEIAILADIGIPIVGATDEGDAIFGFSAEDDEITGLFGDDMINGLSGNDILLGGAGNDTLIGEAGFDSLMGGDGGDVARGGGGLDTLEGGDGNDTLSGGGGNDTVMGENGADSLFGGGGNDLLNGGRGVDALEGGSGNDELRGAQGSDVLSAGGGDDLIFGGAGNDTIFGGAGDDELRGSGGQDQLFGGAGDDMLFGGGGGDTLNGGAGGDTLLGGSGGDIFVLNAGGDDDTATDFDTNVDILRLVGFASSDPDDTVVITEASGGLLISAADGSSSLLLLGLGAEDSAALVFDI